VRHIRRFAFVGIAPVALVLAGCATVSEPTETPDPLFEVSDLHPLDLPPAVDGGGLGASSAPIRDGVAYTFNLGHCGLQSPVDVDGSYWDALDGTAPNGQALDLEADVEMINATPGVIVVIGDELRLRTESGSLVRFARHDGDKEFPPCM
jgi:hypothetical protein